MQSGMDGSLCLCPLLQTTEGSNGFTYPKLTPSNVTSICSDNYKKSNFKNKLVHAFWEEVECGLYGQWHLLEPTRTLLGLVSARRCIRDPSAYAATANVGVCGSCATVPGPRGGDMGIPGWVPVSLWAVPVTTVWLSVVSGPDSQLGFIGLP